MGESARARRTAMIWSASSRSRPMPSGATRWPPRTISRQKSARKFALGLRKGLPEDHGIECLVDEEGVAQDVAQCRVLRGLASDG